MELNFHASYICDVKRACVLNFAKVWHVLQRKSSLQGSSQRLHFFFKSKLDF